MLPATYEEFLEVLNDTFKLTDLGEAADPNFYGRRSENTAQTGDYRLHRTWTTGGMRGGNCWGDSADQPVESEEEPDDTFLDKILEAVVPSLSFLQYRKLTRHNLYDKYDAGYHEYYGNYTEREGRRLSIKRLYDALQDVVGVDTWEQHPGMHNG